MVPIERYKSPWLNSKKAPFYSNTFNIYMMQSDPKESKAAPGYKPAKRIDEIATFEEDTKINGKTRRVTIYNSRAAIFFKTKMAVDISTNPAICTKGNQCCPTQKIFYYVMPQFTNWVQLGDVAMIANLVVVKHFCNTTALNYPSAILFSYGVKYPLYECGRI